MSKIVSWGMTLIGGALIVVALALALVIVPSMKVFPDDVDTTRVFDLNYLTLLDADTMEFYRAEPDNLPENLRIERNIFVEETDGNKTLIRETQTILDGDDELIQQVKYHPLDRKTLATLTDFPEAWTEHDGYWLREGQVIGWGLDVEQRDYDGWSDDTRHVVNLAYDDVEEHGGIETYHFTSHSDAEPIAEAHVAQLGLPTELSIESLRSLAAGMDIEDEETRTQVETLLPLLIRQAVLTTQADADPDNVAAPLVYYYDYDGEYWVEPQTGVLIDTRKYENRTVTFPPEIIDQLKTTLGAMGRDPDAIDSLLPLSVNTFEYVMSPESTADAVDDAQESIDQLTLFGMTIPIGMIAVGIVLAGTGLYGVWDNRKKATPAVSES
jgi:hypothetical protein